MTRLKRVPPVALMAAIVLLGFAALLAGIYLSAGLAPALIVGGVLVMALGLVVDIG